MITVFYDGKCGMCRKEISHYKTIAQKNIFIWCDITKNPDILYKKFNITISQGLSLLHVSDEKGQIFIAEEAFIKIWENLPYYKILAFFVKMKGIKSIASYCYRSFAKRKFKKSQHCQMSLKYHHQKKSQSD